jgi:hypothetical protein
MRRWIVVLALTLASAPSAHAVPGDARLVQGILEWPATLTVEPFVVVRSDEGRWYYAEVKDAKRVGTVPVSAGGRVTVLGTEGTRPHEITALAVSSGDAAALALALMPRVTPIPVTTSSPTSESPRPSSPAVAKPASALRWSDVRGTVHSLAGQELIVRTEDGQLVPVDLSDLRGAAVSLTPGSSIVVYGSPGDATFHAIGLIQQESRPPVRPVAAPPRR